MKVGDFVVQYAGFPGPAAYYGVVRSIDAENVTVWEEFLGRETTEKIEKWRVVDADGIQRDIKEKLQNLGAASNGSSAGESRGT